MKFRLLHLKRFLFASACTVVVIFSESSVSAQVNANASVKTKALYSNLKKIQSGNTFLFGQEFFNSFRFNSGSAQGDATYSDSQAVTGAHPSVLGSDFHYYLEKGTDERGYHTEAVKWAYQQGYVITFDWHISARNRSSYTCSTQGSNPAAPANLAKNIANGNTNGDRDWYLGELDKVIDIINKELIVGQDTIPIVFRTWHEMNGDWFWWGNCSGLTADEYKLLYQLTSTYVKERTKTVLFCWSPNTPFSSTYYPGDDYVDVVGVDAYEVTTTSLRSEVGKVVDFAQAHDKIAVLSETGNRTNAGATSGDNAASYWKDAVLTGIKDDPSGKSAKIAWVLTWINANWSYPYVPHANSSATAKQSFIDFKNSPYVLFGDKIWDVYNLSSTIPVTGVIKSSDVKLTPEETALLTATVVPDNATNKNVSWTTSDPTVATVDSQGVVTAKTVGIAIITATTQNGNLTATISVEVAVPVSVPNDLNGSIGDLQAYPIPSDNMLKIDLNGFLKPSAINIYDTKGKLVYAAKTMEEETVLNIKELLKAGVYVLRVSDSKNISSKRLIVN